ncbi:FAD-dependent oxidoreductase [Candidatus Dojkabacteria bacterium]|uniref:FAD-dependent oxidoreductase n=1 Tax=Candidatus Dojkabacteria bacterium TaxID=2099670 RepID=A0A847VCX0_9BACT|nr:FAD-dependent oxidoreductase [Candidatus Dojkabacteria bacterium]
MPDKINKTYDVAIIGSGPAGLSASIYASRYRLSNIVIGEMLGGSISDAHRVCNYPGFIDTPGIDLSQNFLKQAEHLGGEFSQELVTKILKKDNLFLLETESQNTYYSKTIILTLGSSRNKLGLPNEDFFLGKGVSYCATCDAMFFREKRVAVVGGSNAATMSASMLSDIASEVYIIYRGTELRGDQVWIEDVKEKSNIKIIYSTTVVSLEGGSKLERIKLSNRYNNSEYLEIDGLFIEIGSVPNADLAQQIGVKLDRENYIVVSEDQSTSLEGIWAAGDCTNSSNKFSQVVTAASEGAIAANSIFAFIKKKTV